MENRNNAILIAKDIIKEFEGLRLKAYKCSAGLLTIGYGHVIRSNEEFTDIITKDQAEALLDEDIKIAEYALHRYCHVPLSPNQEAALISFIFNLGAGAFQSSTLRQKLNRGEHILAADELTKWVYAGAIKLTGLIRRRALEKKLFLGDMDTTLQQPQYLSKETQSKQSIKSYFSPIIAIITNIRTSFKKLRGSWV